MQRRLTIWLILILILVAAGAYVDFPGSGINVTLGGLSINRSFDIQQGLDLQGGLRVLLEADLPPDTPLDSRSMSTARQIVEQRVNALGLTEPLVQQQGSNRIVVELPGISDPQQAIETVKQTGLLEFVIIPPGETPPPDGAVIQTYCPVPTAVDCGNPSQSLAPVSADLTATQSLSPTYVTLMTGAAVQDAVVGRDQLGEWIVDFTLQAEGSAIFGNFTSAHVGEFLAIVLDKQVLSAPRINSAITGGSGQISGNFTQDSANSLALQLRYGALPVPLKVVDTRLVGPSLGQDSLNKSLIAGGVGMTIVALFMVLYYRVPGVVAVLALLVYAITALAIFKLIPITLTLAGIAGFLLSTGSALDANILIFERLKEELRNGRALQSAVRPAWQRAWPSIRDSNIATLIICVILFWFGSSFGASVVTGFAVTLLLGVFISLFTALVVTRVFLELTLSLVQFTDQARWFGV